MGLVLIEEYSLLRCDAQKNMKHIQSPKDDLVLVQHKATLARPCLPFQVALFLIPQLEHVANWLHFHFDAQLSFIGCRKYKHETPRFEKKAFQKANRSFSLRSREEKKKQL